MMEHNEKTILSLTINGNRYSAEMNWDVNIDAMLDSFYGMCIFHYICRKDKNFEL